MAVTFTSKGIKYAGIIKEVDFHRENRFIVLCEKAKYSVPQKKIHMPHISSVYRVCSKYNIKLNNKNSAIHGNDIDWIIDKEQIFDYLEKAIETGKWSLNFKKFIYADPHYIFWSRSYSEKEHMNLYKRNNYVLSAGNCFKNWMKDGVFVDGSFHLVKQLYDMLKRRNFE